MTEPQINYWRFWWDSRPRPNLPPDATDNELAEGERDWRDWWEQRPQGYDYERWLERLPDEEHELLRLVIGGLYFKAALSGKLPNP
jgi:hypothetical protein